jgi:hypothetical protein
MRGAHMPELSGEDGPFIRTPFSPVLLAEKSKY